MVSPAASPSVAVDYGEVRGDFEYFLAHSTETAAQIAALRPHLERQAAGAGPIRMLDFGCGAGLFTEQLLRESAIGRGAGNTDCSELQACAETLESTPAFMAMLGAMASHGPPMSAMATCSVYMLGTPAWCAHSTTHTCPRREPCTCTTSGCPSLADTRSISVISARLSRSPSVRRSSPW